MKSFIIGFGLLFFGYLANAQTTNPTTKTYPADSVIEMQIIHPYEQMAEEHGTTPDWVAIKTAIAAKYDTLFADRLTNKAQIYYDYGKDWPAFTAALVRYTSKYESIDDLPKLNLNAGMILRYSTNPDELKAALAWSKHTVDNAPDNTDYRKTYEALIAKKNGK